MTKTEKVLITVKTYPTLSGKYGELVCTAGVKEDGSWVRIYPLPFRRFEQYKRFAKYTWIELQLTKNKADHRPESLRNSMVPGVLFSPRFPSPMPSGGQGGSFQENRPLYP